MTKNLLLLLVFTSIISVSDAQISLTSTNVPKVGMSVRIRSLEDDSLLTFNVGLAGANRIWNYAAFKFDTSAAAISQTNYISPSRTIYANNPAVTGASYAAVDPRYPLSIAYDSVATNSWWRIATTDSTGLTRRQPNERLLNFPWTYNSAFRDSFRTAILDPTTGDSLFINVLNSAKCDGYGTITTAIGTFNCLRVVFNSVQSIELAPGVGLFLSTKSTEWWTGQHPQAVFSHFKVNLDFVGLVDSFASVSSLIQTRVANAEIAKTEVKTYPNPAQNIVNMDIDITENQTVGLTVVNLSGQIMKLDRFEAIQGKQQRAIDVSSFPDGIYLVYLAGQKDRNLGVRKIVVQH
jgi:hypothetical protein